MYTLSVSVAIGASGQVYHEIVSELRKADLGLDFASDPRAFCTWIW